MDFMVFAGLVALLFGVIFLLSPETLRKWNEVANRPILVVDDAIAPFRMWVGIILILAGGYMIWAAFPSLAEMWYIHVLGVLALFFGLLFLAFNNGLKALSVIADRVLLSTDDLVLGARKTVGILLIIVAAYILYAAFIR